MEGSPGGWAREDGQSRMAVGVSETYSFTVPRPWLSSIPDESRPLYPCACTCCVRASRALLYYCVWCFVCLYYVVHAHARYFRSLPSCAAAVMFLSLQMQGGQGTAETTDVNVQGKHPRANTMSPALTLPVLVPALRASNPCCFCIVVCCFCACIVAKRT